MISFSAPSSGAGATLALPTATISSGAASTTATANLSLGSYAVAASLTGAANVSFTLTNTAGIPNPPTGISAVAGDGRAIVSFTPPVNNGGDTITSYTVTAYLNGVATGITSTGTGSPLTITGLANGVAYTFVVTATNTIGTSVGSTASTAVTPAPRTTAIVRALPGPLVTASTLTWRVLFVQPVASAIGTADFALTSTSGSATGTITSVVADATRTRFDVTATAVSGEGTLRLDIVDRGGLLAGFTRGQSYTIVPGIVPVSWGYNDCAQLGDASTTNRSRPVVIPAAGALFGKTVVAASVGGSFTLALCSDGTIAAWGKNDLGQLGNGSIGSYSATPVAVSTSGVLGSRTVVALAAGADFALALCSDGTLAAWGHNNAGQLGNATNVNSSAPVTVSTAGALSGKTIVSIAAGDAAGYAVCSDGTVSAWGRGDLGQLGNATNTNSNVPVAVSTVGASALNGKTVVALAAGSGHAVAACSDGSVAAWGWNYAGQLGNGTTTNANLPVAVTTAGTPLAGEQVVSVACGYSHSQALTRTGGVYGWGQKLWGSLGNGQTAITHPPVETPLAVATNLSGVLAGRTITDLTAGTGETLVLCADGGLAAWGIDHVGQLGDGGAAPEVVNWAGTSYPVSSVPVAVDSGASALAGRFTYSAVSGPAGYHHLALAAPLTVTSVAVPAPTSICPTPRSSSPSPSLNR
ncbi:MAG: fibronectin type III domain-containing protein [Opitutaceae bacterium]|nr:fibronectin type III domain-containing protein [Opitutaceae bacterium]